MILGTTFFLRGERIDYSYNTADETHLVWFASKGKSVCGSAGVVISALRDHRHDEKVRELIAWLSKF